MSNVLSQAQHSDAVANTAWTICEADQSQFKRCDEFVAKANGASLYHLTDWCALVRGVFGHACYYFMAESPQGDIIGVLPVVRLKSKLFGDFMVSMPFFNYGGALGTTVEVEGALIRAAVDKARALGVQHMEFRDTRQRDEFAAVRTDKVAMILPLPDDQDILWKKLGAKRRSQINRPLREGVEVKNGAAELLEDFYRVFSHNMRDLGTPVYSKTLFADILQRFPDSAHIVTVYLHGKPVGGAFLMGFAGQLEIPWASTLRSVNSLGVNMLMYWEVLKYAMSRGYQTFDFGRSSVDSGTYRFKKQWGAEPKQLYWHYWLNDGQQMPGLTPSNPKYQLAIKAWQRLPLFVANRIGPFIVKNLP